MAWLRSKSIWLLLIASLALNAGVGATFGVRAYENYRGPCATPGPRTHGRLAEMLNLTPEQADQMMTAKRKLMEDIGEIRQELRPANEGLTRLMSAPEPDREAIATQVERIASLRGRMQHRLVEHFLEMKERLNEEQKEVFNDFVLRRLFSYGTHGPGVGGPSRYHGKPGRPGGWGLNENGG